MMRRTMVAVAIILVAIVVGSSVAYVELSGKSGSAPKQNTLTYYSEHGVVSTDPADAYDLGGYIVLQNTYDTLVTYQATSISKVIPDLATNWTESSNGLVYTFNLRHGVKFANGDALTAQDVVYTFDRILTMNSPSTGVAWIDSQDLNTSGIKAIGNYTVQFTLTMPFSPFLVTLAAVEPNGIVDEKVVQANGGVIANQDNPYMENNTAGSGPYYVQSYTKGQEIVLAENPYYWKGWTSPHYTKVVMYLDSSASTAVSAAKSGQATLADIAEFSEAQSLESASNFKIVATPIPYTSMVDFNLNSSNSFMANQSVRQALSWAFPYNQTLSTAFKGFAEPLNGSIPSNVYLGQQSEPYRYYNYNLSRASKILDAAGFTNDSQGQRFNGTALSIYDESPQSWMVTEATLFQNALAKIGIVTDIHSVPTSTYFQVQTTNKWDIMTVDWVLDYNDPSDFAIPFAGSLSIGGDTDLTYYNNSIVDNAILDGMSTTNVTQEIADYHTVWAQENLNPNNIWVATIDYTVAVSNTLSNYSFNAVLMYDFYFYIPATTSAGTSALSITSMMMASVDEAGVILHY